MGDWSTEDAYLQSDFTYLSYSQPPPPEPIAPITSGDVTIITTINGGGGGRATGPSLTLGSNWNGVNFVAQGNNGLNIDILNAANARADLGAAKSGANDDINTFTALTGSTGWSAWTGTPDKTSHATFSGTASVGYVQAELQAVMDSLKQTTEAVMALLTTLLASGVLRP